MGFFTTRLENGFSGFGAGHTTFGGRRRDDDSSSRGSTPRGARHGWRVALVLLAGALALGLAGCDFFTEDEPVLPIGTWDAAGSWGDRYVVTATSIEYFGRETENGPLVSNYRADIIGANDSAFNGGDTAIKKDGPVASNPGFAVFRYTQVKNASWGEVGKFNVLRWSTNASDSRKRDMGQGGTYNADYTVMNVFSSSADAVNGATIANGHFGMVSESLTRQ